MNFDFLKNEERISLQLKTLYKSYGFEEYKLSSFEEYSLYADNVSFLADSDVIAFNAGGKLLALRPDVTLSIIKNVNTDATRKLYYDENVYRKTAHGNFAEVSQIGVEIIGRVDEVARAEICSLMFGTLSVIGKKFVIEASHVGIVSKALDGLSLSEPDRDFALKCLRGKNAHDFRHFAADRNLKNGASEIFAKLIGLPSAPTEAISGLQEIGRSIDIGRELCEIEELYGQSRNRVNIDFSIDGDADYYNGLIFKGYVEGVPHAVLSGGRYDKLLRKFGKSAEALGFALYLGELGRYLEDTPDMPDVAVVYGDGEETRAFQTAEKLRSEGGRVLACRELPEGFRGKVITAEDKV